MSNLAIKVEHLSKIYRLGEINNGTLKNHRIDQLLDSIIDFIGI